MPTDRRSRLRLAAACGAALAAFLAAGAAFAQVDDATIVMEEGKANLATVFGQRPDLRQTFRADWSVVPGSAASRTMKTLEDWARKYGYMEYPGMLDAYAPEVARVTPRALRDVASAPHPTLAPGAKFDFSSITASSVFVVDVGSRKTLMAHNARAPHPLASITKLMTALVTMGRKVPMGRVVAISKNDEVGGARLNVRPGTALTVRDLLNVALIGSANNTANALARSTKLSKPAFVAQMNAKASALGLADTRFTDPTGIDVGNVSTAEDIAALGLEAFAQPDIKRATTTAHYTVTLARGTHVVKNTDDLLVNEENGLVVLGGKTGYLEESKWNLVVKLMDARKRPIEVVVLGTDSRAQSFADASAVATWIWQNYDWTSGN
jgi:D-alanyl-D-alanine endopeptidase (penicillin-binding protein 7)